MKRNSVFKMILLCAVALCIFSVIAISLTAGIDGNHECTGEDCFVCAYIAVRNSIIEGQMLTCILICAAILLGGYVLCSRLLDSFTARLSTPVFLKVKLSN